MAWAYQNWLQLWNLCSNKRLSWGSRLDFINFKDVGVYGDQNNYFYPFFFHLKITGLHTYTVEKTNNAGRKQYLFPLIKDPLTLMSTTTFVLGRSNFRPNSFNLVVISKTAKMFISNILSVNREYIWHIFLVYTSGHVLPISFPLFSVAANQDDPQWKAKEIKRMLYRAPEFLRDPSPPARGSQKGDVYSFAIVLYEIIGRQGPWGRTNMDAHGEFPVSKRNYTEVHYLRYNFRVEEFH